MKPEREDLEALVNDRGGAGRLGARVTGIIRLDPARGQRSERVVVGVKGEPELLEVVEALGTAGRFPGGLHGWKDKADQERDHRDDDQGLDKRKTSR